MIATIKKTLDGIRLGEARSHGGLTVFPLFLDEDDGPAYVTLDEALAGGAFAITEVSAGGSVPELRAVNGKSVPVLILDGEELVGAKQNRILNTSVLVPGGAEITIPVSCVEQGRWQHCSDRLVGSNAVASSALRTQKMESVTQSLERTGTFRSDQGGVWDAVADISARAAVCSPTSALRDVYEKSARSLDGYLDAFPCEAGQRGLVAFIGGKPAGFETISRAEAFARLYPKLLRSYALEASLAKDGKKGSEEPPPGAEAALRFVGEAKACSGKRFKSPGAGHDHRFAGGVVVGSSLVSFRRVIHAAFFTRPQPREKGDDSMSRPSRRAAFRGWTPGTVQGGPQGEGGGTDDGPEGPGGRSGTRGTSGTGGTGRRGGG